MKREKEITVKVNCSYDILHSSLLKQGFRIVREFQLNDVYMFPCNINISSIPILELLKECILVRDIVGIRKTLTHKYKKCDEKSNILEQEKSECEILDIDDGIRFMELINYKELLRTFAKCIIYANSEIEIAVQLVNDKYILIEMENTSELGSKRFNTIEEMIEDLEKYDIDYDRSSYFVRKAELVFNDKYK